MERLKSPSDLEELRNEILARKDPKKPAIAVCVSTGCEALGVKGVLKVLKEELKKQNVEGSIEIKETGCLGFCEKGPRIVVYPEEIYYFKVTATDVPEIVSKTLLNNEIVERLLYADPVTGQKARNLAEIPFYKYQKRLLLDNSAKLDPKKIEDYIALGGYKALAKALFQMKPEQVLEEVKRANLRGRGGGGFPTARKMGVHTKRARRT
jgi:NADH-quinone oxidoreductase subunit F